MELTEKLGLKKPGLTDYVNIGDLNDNMDILNAEVERIDTNLETHKADLASQEINKGASLIGLNDSASKFVATNVEGAMSELFTNVSSGKSLVGGAITGVDDSVVIPTDPTFSDLASAIGSISTGKKWANGTSVSDEINMVEVTNLNFKPSLIIILGEEQPANWSTIYASLFSPDRYYSSSWAERQIIFREGYITDVGFKLYYQYANKPVNWIAYE